MWRFPIPEGLGLRAAMEHALRATGTAAEEVDYVNAHATSTPIGDVSEAKALKAIFKTPAARPAISSTKSLTGHGLSLAGAMESGFCALAIRDGFMPGSAHITTLDPACDGPNIIRSTLSAQPHVVLQQRERFAAAPTSSLVLQAGQLTDLHPYRVRRPRRLRPPLLHGLCHRRERRASAARRLRKCSWLTASGVWGTARDPSRLQPLGAGPAGAAFTPVKLDLADGRGADDAFARAAEKCRRRDFDLVIQERGVMARLVNFPALIFPSGRLQLEAMLLTTRAPQPPGPRARCARAIAVAWSMWRRWRRSFRLPFVRRVQYREGRDCRR